MKLNNFKAPIFAKSFADDVLGLDESGGIGGMAKSITDPVEDFGKSVTGQTAEDAAKSAAAKAAMGQQAAADFLLEREAPGREYQQQAMNILAGLAGLGDGSGKAEFVEGLKDDPFYQQQLADAEEALLRNRSVIGVRGSGSANQLAKLSPSLLSNLYNERVGALQGFMSMPDQSTNIANLMAGKEATLAQGDIAGAQARQGAYGNLLGLAGTVGGAMLGGGFGGASAAPAGAGSTVAMNTTAAPMQTFKGYV